MVQKYFFCLLLCVLCSAGATGQTFPDTLQPKRLRTVLWVEAGAYSGLLLGLNELWYEDYEQEPFHFFNDNNEWHAVDKVGHGYSAYQLSRIHYQALRWTGLSPAKAALWSGIGGLAWMLPIEVLDGFSAAYGASPGDLIANTSGVLLFAGQQLLWQQQFLYPKFSFHPTDWASQRPALLGNSFPEQVLKDYNGQTYWLSADLHTLSRGRLPSWINLAVGYGASGMIYADPVQNQLSGHTDFKQFFLSPDLNLRHIRSNKKAVRLLLFVLEGIRLPAPAIEFSRNKLYFHPLYF